MKYIIRNKYTNDFMEGFNSREEAEEALKEYHGLCKITEEKPVREKDFVFPVLRDHERAFSKLWHMNKDDRYLPMQYLNWFCSFCCPHLKEGTSGLTCRRDSCIFGRLRRKFFNEHGEPAYAKKLMNSEND